MHRHEHSHHEHDKTLGELRDALTAGFWDERYGGTDRVWSGRPNQRLVEQLDAIPDLAPGRALDVACGEGADAVWLAKQGWQVTAVDVSQVALAKVAAHAEEEGVGDRIRIGFYDALADPRPVGHHTFDLVTVSFLHVPLPDFPAVYRGIADAVAPGGRLLVVAHHPDDVTTGARHDHGPGLMFEPERVIETLGADRPDSPWEVEVADTPVREQATPEGPLRVRDTVVRLRRR
ncbi:SAM-dependent methyltransferase [Nocardioides daeguensis]|uniref:Class I SAM-dependent methyltransferase n=1 Tax=Nocardioides daeguensis TaxID=908359 RepID=A0ABP6VV21_9ACTN|nr:class I SAM-dependent methyltransferase [Nocardioides daeguensis]MBV6728442.1 class I SAM-dependent methyltransferase [Nocardioides daeguensis]MCR1773866.1 class I SAM-dependent methyltransferase [Nocardioides daeguensis]